MKTLKFNKEYYLPIISNDKTQTLRLKNKHLKENEIVKAIFPGTEFTCRIKITKTGYKQFQYLNDEDAELEGYDTLEELQETLTSIYPRIDKFNRLYYYRFKVIK